MGGTCTLRVDTFRVMTPRSETLPAKTFSIGLLLVLVGCGADSSPAPSPWTPASAVSVELPDPERLEATTRDRLQRLLDRANATLERDPAAPEAVATAFGELGAHLAAVGMLGAAGDAFENARRADPSAFRWPYLLAVALQDDSHLEDAILAYGDALAVGAPDAVQETAARLHRLEAFLQLGRLDDAETELEAVRALDREEGAAFLFAAARIAAGRQRHGDAVSLFEATLDLDPTASAVRYPLSRSYAQLGNEDAAAYHATRRGDKKPRFADPAADEVGRLVSLTALEVARSRAAASDFDPVADLGFVLANLSNVGGAPEQLERILSGESRPTRPEEEARLRYLLGGLWVARDKDTPAELHFRRAVDADPSFVAAWVKLGNVAARAGRHAEAHELYSKAVEVSGGAAIDAALKRAAASWALGRGQDAARELEAALKDAAGSGLKAQVVAAAAATWDRLDRPDKAERLLRDALSAGTDLPENAVLHKAVGDRLRRAGQFDDALAAYEKALRLAPDLSEAGLGAAAILGHLGRLDESARIYGDILTATPRSVTARRGEVTALLLARRYREAARSLRRAVEIFDGERGLEWRHARARLLAACPDGEIRNGTEALRLAEGVFEDVPSLKHGETLAMAYAAVGNYRQAAVIQRNLLDELRRAGRSDLSPDLGRRLSLYEQHRPFLAAEPDALIVTAPAGGGA